MTVRHILVYLLGKGFPGVLSFISIYLYTRLLLPEQYGEYAIMFAAAGLLNAVVFQWIRVSVLRFLPRFRENIDSLVTTVFLAFLASSILAGIIFLILSAFEIKILEVKKVYYLIVFFVTLSLGWFELNLEMLRSQLSSALYSFISVARSVLTLVISLVLIKFGFGTISLMVGMLIGNMLPVLVLTRKLWGGVRLSKFDQGILLDLLKYGLPLTATFALTFVMYSSSRFLLNYFGETLGTGVYSVTYDFAQQTLILLMMIINLATYPIIVRTLEEKGIAAAKEKIKEHVSILLFVSIPATVGLIMLASSISSSLFGEEYRSVASNILPWIAVVGFMQGFKIYYIDLSFQLGKSTYLQIWPVLFAAVINIVTNWILIPTFGVLGAVYASIISYGVSIIVSFFLSRRVFPLPFSVRDATMVILSCIVMCLFMYPLLNYKGWGMLIIQILVGGLGYIIACFLFNTCDFRIKFMNIIKSRKVRHAR